MIGGRRCVMDIKRLGNESIQQQSSLKATEKTSDVDRSEPGATKQAEEIASETTTTASKSNVASQISDLKRGGMSKVAELKSKLSQAGSAELPDLGSTDSEIASSNTKSKGPLEFAQQLESLKFNSLTEKTAMLPLGSKQQAVIAGKELALELPRMIAKAGADPEKLLASIQDRSTLPTTNFAILGSMPDGDIEALSFLVLMEASKSAQEDLKAIMDQVKSVAQAKANLRAELQTLNSHSRKAKKKGDDD